MRSGQPTLSLLLTFVVFCANDALAAGPDVCSVLPIATVNELVHQNLVGARADISEQANSYGCSYGPGGPVSVSIIRPGGAAAFARTTSRYPNAATVAGLGNKAVFDKRVGVIALFGDTVIDAFVSPGNLTDAELLAIEKSLVLALQKKL
jgi:hypothetical protein